MGRTSEPGFPHKGWTLESVTDVSTEGVSYEDYPSCEFCDKKQIRYVHTLTHDQFPEVVAVGCDCAEFLTADYVNPKRKERELRNAAARRKREAQRREKFPEKRWEHAGGGALWTELDGSRIGIISAIEGGYKIKINGEWGKLIFSNQREAQLRAYDVVQQRKSRIRRWLDNPPPKGQDR